MLCELTVIMYNGRTKRFVEGVSRSKKLHFNRQQRGQLSQNSLQTTNYLLFICIIVTNTYTFCNITAVEYKKFFIYRVFIKYCVFSNILKYIPDSGLSRFPLDVSVCTQWHCSKIYRVQKNHNILRKKHNI